MFANCLMFVYKKKSQTANTVTLLHFCIRGNNQINSNIFISFLACLWCIALLKRFELCWSWYTENLSEPNIRNKGRKAARKFRATQCLASLQFLKTRLFWTDKLLVVCWAKTAFSHSLRKLRMAVLGFHSLVEYYPEHSAFIGERAACYDAKK